MEALDESVFQMSGISFHIVHFNKLETARGSRYINGRNYHNLSPSPTKQSYPNQMILHQICNNCKLLQQLIHWIILTTVVCRKCDTHKVCKFSTRPWSPRVSQRTNLVPRVSLLDPGNEVAKGLQWFEHPTCIVWGKVRGLIPVGEFVLRKSGPSCWKQD